MNSLLSRDEWLTLSRLYVAGRRGITGNGHSYPAAGTWQTLRALRDYTPTLAREVFRHDERGQMYYLVMITEAGEEFYERNERLYKIIYPDA